MPLLPIGKVWQRVESGRGESDVTLFTDLMYLGEMAMKLVVSELVAAVEDDKDQSRYRLLHTLVRADGIGAWDAVLDDVLTGLSSQHLVREARVEQAELTQKLGTAHGSMTQYLGSQAACRQSTQPSSPSPRRYLANDGSHCSRNCVTRPEAMALRRRLR